MLCLKQNKGKEQIQKDIPRQKVSNRHLSCFSFSATLNNIAVKMVVHIFFQVSVFFPSEKYPEVELLYHMIEVFLIF